MDKIRSIRKAKKDQLNWNSIMSEVWQAQKRVKDVDRTPNPVLRERQRRRH
jgi:hypothetical protein